MVWYIHGPQRKVPGHCLNNLTLCREITLRNSLVHDNVSQAFHDSRGWTLIFWLAPFKCYNHALNILNSIEYLINLCLAIIRETSSLPLPEHCMLSIWRQSDLAVFKVFQEILLSSVWSCVFWINLSICILMAWSQGWQISFRSTMKNLLMDWINPTDYVDPLTFPLVPPWGWYF